MKKFICILLLLFSVSSQAQITRNYLVVMRTTGEHVLYDNDTIRIFGFSPTYAADITLPGKILYANEGDTVVIDAFNFSQGYNHTIHLHGLDVDTRNDGDPSTSFSLEHLEDTT